MAEKCRHCGGYGYGGVGSPLEEEPPCTYCFGTGLDTGIGFLNTEWDAARWATEFQKRFAVSFADGTLMSVVDVERLLATWFTNAIQSGFGAGWTAATAFWHEDAI